MKSPFFVLAAPIAIAMTVLPADARKCPEDSVRVGAVCIDKYEASVWETTDPATIKRIRKGTIQAVTDLALATLRGDSGDDYDPGCPDNASGCTNVYAVSIPGVLPSQFATWFQAAAACANAGKRLPTNQEWQAAALGTPDPGTDNLTTDCNLQWGVRAATGSRSLCQSDRGAYDMVGNLPEWVAEWIEFPSGCDSYDAAFGNDVTCFGGSGNIHAPAALMRGLAGVYSNWAESPTVTGVFPGSSTTPDGAQFGSAGFRCVREP